ARPRSPPGPPPRAPRSRGPGNRSDTARAAPSAAAPPPPAPAPRCAAAGGASHAAARGCVSPACDPPRIPNLPEAPVYNGRSMGNFMGGSAPAMANQIAEGFILLSQATLRGFTDGELNLLRFELEKLQRDARAEVPPQDDAMAQQVRNRKISRLSSAVQVVNHQLTRKVR